MAALWGEELLAAYRRLQELGEPGRFAEMFEPAALAGEVLGELIRRAQTDRAQARERRAAAERQNGGQASDTQGSASASGAGAVSLNSAFGAEDRVAGWTDNSAEEMPAALFSAEEAEDERLFLGEAPELPGLFGAAARPRTDGTSGTDGYAVGERSVFGSAAEAEVIGGGAGAGGISGISGIGVERRSGSVYVGEIAANNVAGRGSLTAEEAGGEWPGGLAGMVSAGHVNGAAARTESGGLNYNNRREEELQELCELVAERLGDELAVYLQSRPWPLH